MGLFTVRTEKGFDRIESLVDIHNPAFAFHGNKTVYIPTNLPIPFDDESRLTLPYTLDKNVRGNKLRVPESTVGLVQIPSLSLSRFTLPRVVVLVPLEPTAQISAQPSEDMQTMTFYMPREMLIGEEIDYAKAAVALAIMAVADGTEFIPEVYSK